MDEDEDVEVSEMEKVFHNNLREQIVSIILVLSGFRVYLFSCALKKINTFHDIAYNKSRPTNNIKEALCLSICLWTFKIQLNCRNIYSLMQIFRLKRHVRDFVSYLLSAGIFWLFKIRLSGC